jgi:Bacterial Ig-like domain (group 2)/Divergent InlB B-repeat domain
MSARIVVCLSLAALVLFLSGCAADPGLVSMAITPSTGATTLHASGETVQFKAMGTFQRGNHPATTRDITNEVTWESSNPSVATINSAGLVTCVSSGRSIITATYQSGLGPVSGTTDVTAATGSGYTGDSSTHVLTSIAIIPAPGFQKVNTVGETAQFIGIGSFNSDPTTDDVTKRVTWQSSDVRVATINSAGLATTVGLGKTQITAIATSITGAVVTGNSDLEMLSPGGDVKLPTLTVYKVGLGTGRVFSGPNPTPAGETPVIDCGSGASCTGHFVLGSTVQLTAVPGPGSKFGGWSSNCIPTPAPDSATCTITMPNNDSVGAIFNVQ